MKTKKIRNFKHIYIPLIIFTLIIFGCGTTSEEDDFPERTQKLIEIKNTDSFYFDLDRYNNDTWAKILVHPKNYVESELYCDDNTNWKWTYYYKPAENFTGEDLVKIELCRKNYSHDCTRAIVVELAFNVIE